MALIPDYSGNHFRLERDNGSCEPDEYGRLMFRFVVRSEGGSFIAATWAYDNAGAVAGARVFSRKYYAALNRK